MESHVYQMRQMNDKDLADHLRSLDYMPADIDKDNDLWEEHKIRTDEAGNRFYHVQHRNRKTDEVSYSYDAFTWDELMGDLKKEKKL